MRMPEKAPDLKEVMEHFRTIRLGDLSPVDAASRKSGYPHWEEVRRANPPDGLTHHQWWAWIRVQRMDQEKALPLAGKDRRPFVYCEAAKIPEALHKIDLRAGGIIRMAHPLMNPDMRDRYYVSSLIEEAIASSQIEGAHTTREKAREMLREGRAPKDRSERMILNNYRTMQEITRWKNEELTPDLIREIHKLVTRDTLDKDDAGGRFRRPEEKVVVSDQEGTPFHVPPPAEELEHRVAAMCEFASGLTPNFFVHPVVRAVIFHFWLAYDHPFVDGNGRTARALFYWAMLRYGYWLFEFVSISPVILKAPTRYYRAFLHSETDNNDLTYFLAYHMEVIERAIEALHEYIHRKQAEIESLETRLRGVTLLNHRQRALVSHALRHSNHRYSIASHQRSHNVVYQTARTDLLDLQRRGLLDGAKRKRTWYFTPLSDLEQRLKHLQ